MCLYCVYGFLCAYGTREKLCGQIKWVCVCVCVCVCVYAPIFNSKAAQLGTVADGQCAGIRADFNLS